MELKKSPDNSGLIINSIFSQSKHPKSNSKMALGVTLSYFFEIENKNSNPPSGLFLTEISPL